MGESVEIMDTKGTPLSLDLSNVLTGLSLTMHGHLDMYTPSNGVRCCWLVVPTLLFCLFQGDKGMFV